MKLIDAKRFHDDLRAAVVAGVPLEINGEISGTSVGLLSLANIDSLESLILPHRSEDESDDHLDWPPSSDLHREFPARYCAALQTFDQTQTMAPVLDGLTTPIVARRNVALTLRWAFIYLLLLLLVAWMGLLIFSVRVVPAFENMRTDLLLPAVINAPERVDVIQWLPLTVPALGVGFVILLIWLLAGGAGRVAMWLGGQHYVRCQTSKTTLRTIQMLAGSGMPVDDAISISCDLTGASSVMREDLRNSIQDSQSALQLETLANYFSVSAKQRLAYLKVATPIALVATFGGGIGLLYCISIFWPIVSMVKDLATAGT